MNKIIINKVAKNIKFYRKEKNMTQEALAFGAKVSLSTIGMIETAKTDITLSKIYNIAKALDVEPYELLK